MKIDRLIGIITLLLQKEKTTTRELAERFEVSPRTIQRDIDDICKAGIPVMSIQGYGGGLAIADGYKLDKTVLTEKELQAILIGIKSIDSVSKTPYSQTLMEKLSNGKHTVFAEHDKILIDLASWYQDSLPDKIELIKRAIFNHEQISFSYYSNKGVSERTLEPYLILFKWSAWYMFGYCLTQNGYRLFKLNRLWNLQNTNIHYNPREIPDDELHFDRFFETEEIKLVALFDQSEKYRLIEEYGIECFTVVESGKLLFEKTFSNPPYVIQWILSFGDHVMVMEPRTLVSTICEHAENILQQYK